MTLPIDRFARLKDGTLCADASDLRDYGVPVGVYPGQTIWVNDPGAGTVDYRYQSTDRAPDNDIAGWRYGGPAGEPMLIIND